jgi:hypothetical protein
MVKKRENKQNDKAVQTHTLTHIHVDIYNIRLYRIDKTTDQ